MEKNTGKVREKSGNFVSPEKWEPCVFTPVCHSVHRRGVSQHAMGQGVYPSMQLARGCVSQHVIGQWVCIPACNWTGGHEGVGIVIKWVCVGRVVNLWFALLLWPSGWEWPSVMTFWSTPPHRHTWPPNAFLLQMLLLSI